MTLIVDIDAAETRAQRAADGMTYNRDTMFREHAAMAAELRRWRQAYEKAKQPGSGAYKGFADAFDELFGGIFGHANRGR